MTSPSTPVPVARIPFTKMHGLGNDYVYVDAFAHRVEDPASLAVAISDRHRGVGSDGLILIEPPRRGVAAHVRMRMFNADGSESEMCGNGVRCVAKYAIDHRLVEGGDRPAPLRVETGRGVLDIDYALGADGRVAEATVDMGAPIREPAAIPVDVGALAPATFDAGRVAGSIAIGDDRFGAVFVSMGNPHAVIFVDDVAVVDLERIGPAIERHPACPRRINVHFVQVHSPGEVTMRTWERGSGVTQACGTGASAVCVAGAVDGRTSRRIVAHLPGGDLRLHWRETDDHVLMSGPATEVFQGVWEERRDTPGALDARRRAAR
ncbi:MAG: diaminopimelate epimerase [Phycisphaerales bacterium]